METLPTPPRNVRAILIQQQERAPNIELALPAILRNPFLILLWMLVLSTVVAALSLGRIRVPRTARGLVVASPTDSLTPVLLLPAWSRTLLHSGDIAFVDTGGPARLRVTISTIDTSALTLTAARRWLDAPNASFSTIDTSMVVAHLTPCTGPRCPKLARGTRYTATARLGTRPLASFVVAGT